MCGERCVEWPVQNLGMKPIRMATVQKEEQKSVAHHPVLQGLR